MRWILKVNFFIYFFNGGGLDWDWVGSGGEGEGREGKALLNFHKKLGRAGESKNK